MTAWKVGTHRGEEEVAAVALSGLVEAEAAHTLLLTARIHVEHRGLAQARDGYTHKQTGIDVVDYVLI